MNSLKIELQPNCELNVDILCPKCQQNFSTELDLIQTSDNLPSSIEQMLYCHICENPLKYTATIIEDRFEIYFKDSEVSVTLSISENTELEDFETISPLKSKNFYLLQIERLRKILKLDAGEFIVDQTLNRLVFSGTITCMETYLNEILLYVVFYSNNTLQKFVENYEPYKKESLSLNEIFKKREEIELRVREDLNSLLYHNIPKLINIYNIFHLNLGQFTELKSLAKNIQLRHNFVHRSGVDKNDSFIEISKVEVSILIDQTNSLIEYINKRIDDKCFTDEWDFAF